MSRYRLLSSFLGEMLNPRKIFTHRNRLEVWQLTLLVILINSLLLLPSAVRYMSMRTYDMDRIIPNALGALTEDTAPILQEGQIQGGRYKGKSDLVQSYQSIVASLPSKTNLETIKSSGQHSLVLTEKEWQFYYPSGRSLSFRVQGNHNLKDLKNLEAVRNLVNRQWFSSYRIPIITFLLIQFIATIYTGSLIFLLGGGVALTLVQKDSGRNIEGFREALGLLVHCSIFPSILVFLLSLLTLVVNPFLLTILQVMGSLLILVWVFVDTDFRDRPDLGEKLRLDLEDLTQI